MEKEETKQLKSFIKYAKKIGPLGLKSIVGELYQIIKDEDGIYKVDRGGFEFLFTKGVIITGQRIFK